MSTLEKGLAHRHTECQTVQMRKANGEKAKQIRKMQKFLLTTSARPHPQSPNFPILASPLTLDEVKAALQRMANGKAPGPSG
eukprot:4859595-Ditylum_brightwellii.AAC.1